MRYKLFLVVCLLLGCFCFSQESYTEEIYELDEILKKKKTPKFLKYNIHKDNEKPDQYSSAGIIEIYKDSLIYYKFKEDVNKQIIRTRKVILDKEAITYTNLFFNDFEKYKPKCYRKSIFYKRPQMRPAPNFHKNNVGFSKEQWVIYSLELDKDGEYMYKSSFKSRLLKFKCLNIFKNLKSRRDFKKLMKLLNDVSGSVSNW